MPANRSSELRIPTKVVAVRLALAGTEPIAAEMFISDVRRRGRSHLLDDLAVQLAAEATFVPVRWSNRVRLLAKHAVAWVAVPRHDPDATPALDFSDEASELTLYDREHRVEIDLTHGARLTGTLLDSSPADHPRLVDHLNRAGRFVRLWTPDEHYLINTMQVVAVTELDEAT